MNRDNLIVGDLVLEFGVASVFTNGESICGDFWCQDVKDDQQILVLSDGMGSGVKANILATLTAKMLSAMMAGNIPIDECIMTISETLPFWPQGNRTMTWQYGFISSSYVTTIQNFTVTAVSGSIFLLNR